MNVMLVPNKNTNKQCTHYKHEKYLCCCTCRYRYTLMIDNVPLRFICMNKDISECSSGILNLIEDDSSSFRLRLETDSSNPFAEMLNNMSITGHGSCGGGYSYVGSE